MPDELPVNDGAPEAPQTPDPAVDYERRWKDTHANWNTLNEQHSKFKQDPDAVIEFIREHHPDLLATDEEPDDDEPDYEPAPTAKPDPRIDWLAAREATRQYSEDLKEVVGDRELTGKKANDWIEARSRAIAASSGKPWDKNALSQAVDDYFELVEDVRGPTRKPAPTPPAPGKAGEPKYDPKDRNARRARMAAAIEAANQQ